MMLRQRFFFKKEVLVASLAGLLFAQFFVTAAEASLKPSFVEVANKQKNGAGAAQPCKGTNIDFISAGEFSSGSSFVTDSSGNFYVAGTQYFNKISHWIVRKSVDGTTWTTVDDFQYEPGVATHEDVYPAIGTDIHGNIYVAGSGWDRSSVLHWIVRKSTDQGKTWVTVDDFLLQKGKYSKANAFASDENGTLYVSGYGVDKNGFNWIVRKSLDGGATWIIADKTQLTTGAATEANVSGVDVNGNVYVAGFATGSGGYHWYVRKSSDGGLSWQTVDNFQLDGKFSYANSFAAAPNGDIYVGGAGATVSSSPISSNWVVRKSSDGGVTWTTVDTFHFMDTDAARTIGLAVNGSGHVYATGWVGNNEYVRRSTDNGLTWTTVDTVNGSRSRGIGTDNSGKVYTVGMLRTHWLTRKLACN